MNSQERPRRLDAVEIKVTVGADGISAAAEAFELEHAEKRRRTIYFCEDLAGPDGPAGLPLLTHGIILRLRRNKGRRDDITAKLRPCSYSQLTQRWINASEDEDWDFRVEGDWAGPRHVISASLEAKVEDGIIEAVVAEGLGIPLVPAQRRFLEDCAGVRVDLSRLSPLGPLTARNGNWPGTGRKFSPSSGWLATDFASLSSPSGPDRRKPRRPSRLSKTCSGNTASIRTRSRKPRHAWSWNTWQQGVGPDDTEAAARRPLAGRGPASACGRDVRCRHPSSAERRRHRGGFNSLARNG